MVRWWKMPIVVGTGGFGLSYRRIIFLVLGRDCCGEVKRLTCREGLVVQTTRRELVPASPFGGQVGAACVAVMVCIRSPCG